MNCSAVRTALGAYVLGALEPTERSKVDAHLPLCAACRDELSELAGLPGLLGRLTADEVLAGPVRPEPALLERFLARVARHRRRTRRRILVAAAAAAVLVLGAGGTAAVLRDVAPHPRVLSAEGPSISGTVVRASVGVLGKAWGTELTLRLRGVPRGEHCRLVAVARDGRTEVAGSWEVSYTGATNLTGATAIHTKDLRSLKVVTYAGQELVAVPVSS